MRMNIELDDALLDEVMSQNGKLSKEEVIHLALLKLVEFEKKKRANHRNFLAKYTTCPEQIDDFMPLSRNEVNERISDLC